jgi:glycosyltransferase involved in cell wall biosynthesis
VLAGKTLGELRNESVALARGTLVCQWDDDDRSHPDRLRIQIQALLQENASACYLTQQLHRFVDSGEQIAEDWSHDLYPRNVVQGSAVVRRDAMPRYPALRRGEDTALLHALIEAGEPIARVEGQPWLYCYQFHGGNTFERAHHVAIAQAKRLSPAAMMNARDALEVQTARFVPALQ